jgi:hypothetical protein
MKKPKTEIVHEGKLIAVKIYFTDAQLVDRIANIADGLGLSISGAAGLVIRAGIAEVEKATGEIIGREKNAKKKNQ